jgi:hypothetical protein
MKKTLLSIALSMALGSAMAMTEAEMLEAATASLAQMQAGKKSELAHNKYIYGLVADMPASYRFKAENLRIFGARIDTLEAVEAGKITKEKGQRELALQDAEYQNEVLKRDTEAAQRAEAARAQQRARNEAISAQEEEQRRALAIQMLQNRPPPVQVTPYQMPMPRTCQTVPVYGGGFQTRCN